MNRSLLTILLFGLIPIAASPAIANNWQAVYQADFSSDPGWITNWPDRYVWDPATGTYCFSHIMYTYSYVPIAYDPTLKYKLEFDINLTQCEWGSYFNLGLWDADMLTKEPTHWHVRYHHVDEGNSACIVYWTNDLSGGGGSTNNAFCSQHMVP